MICRSILRSATYLGRRGVWKISLTYNNTTTLFLTISMCLCFYFFFRVLNITQLFGKQKVKGKIIKSKQYRAFANPTQYRFWSNFQDSYIMSAFDNFLYLKFKLNLHKLEIVRSHTKRKKDRCPQIIFFRIDVTVQTSTIRDFIKVVPKTLLSLGQFFEFYIYCRKKRLSKFFC